MVDDESNFGFARVRGAAALGVRTGAGVRGLDTGGAGVTVPSVVAASAASGCSCKYSRINATKSSAAWS